MPELNNNFMKGRMNKDLDERLVANGEYRDALNIEVSTSEGANVGTVQTTMGNTNVGTGFGTCVASIADEKNDDIYWLVAGSSSDGKDAVLKYHRNTTTNTNIVTPVLVDVWKTTKSLLTDGGGTDESEYLIISNLGEATDNITNVRKGMVVTGTFTNNSGGSLSVMGNTVANGATYTLTAADGVVVDKVKNDSPATAGLRVYLTTTSGPTIYTLFPSKLGDSITFTMPEKDRALQFDASRLITGLNIIDDLMFWTDNHSEPKKINITKCIEGTKKDWVTSSSFSPINTHTSFIIKDLNNELISYNNQNFALYEHILKEHITVIKKSPLIAPNLVMDDTEVSRGIINTSIFTSFSDGTQNLVPFQNTIIFDSSDMTPIPDWFVDDIILATNDANAVDLFETWQVRLKLIDITGTSYTFELIGITAEELNFNSESWKFVLERSAALFEFKFPRFGYRYKYQDGEYSSFSPWSEVAFLPGPFDYNPKKGYNLGMRNQLRNLKIKDFIEEDSVRPHGVTSIDILYKESNSPNVYTVKNITTDDPEWSAAGTNLNSANTGLTRGSIAITSELIHALVPSNQSIRHWDSVPRKALAQDISSNRIIYGNYLENYNLKDISSRIIKIDTVINIESNTSANINNPKPSIKSLRTYQVGLVYRDEYGRETPVLSSKVEGSGTVNLKKGVADKQNKIKVQLKHEPPTFAKSFKFFVKETSNEYYNLCMDRWYDAEDGNIWLSFPSAERNKVDEDTYLILKKQHDTDVFVTEEARYKVIAIENEVPDFVKIEKKPYGSLTNNSGRTLFGNSGGGYPEKDVDFIYVDKVVFDESALSEAGTDTSSGAKYLRFKTTATQSHWYEIANFSEIEVNNTGYADTYMIQLTKPFEKDINFTTESATAIGTGIWADRIGTGNSNNTPSSSRPLKLEIARNVEEVKPEHRGRFFVKIFKDGTLQKNVLSTMGVEQDKYISVFSEPIYYLNANDWHDFGGASYYEQVPGDGSGSVGFWGQVWDVVTFSLREDRAQKWWRMFGSHWFIDNAQTRTNSYSTYWGNVPDADNDGPNGVTAGGITNNNKTIQLAFAGVYAAGSGPDGNNNVPNHSHDTAPNLDIGVNANLEEKTWVTHITTPGTVFKWSKDPDGTFYVVEKCERYKSGARHNDDENPPIIDELHNFDAKYKGRGSINRQAANQRVRWEVTVGQWTPGTPKPTASSPGLGIGVNTPSGYDPRYTTIPASGGSNVSGANHYNNAHAIEILEPQELYEDDFSSTNPAIWETEPKEDIGLDLYYEASNANPIELDYKTNEIYIPVTSYLTLPSDRTWVTTNNTYVAGGSLKVTAFNDDTITVNDRPEDSNGLTLVPGDVITFTRPGGSMVTGTVVSIANAGNSYLDIKLEKRLHNQKYYLDWHNCFSFGNGVESNRIRDDFNAVTIDKGPKVSTTLAVPYEEERKCNGLIYSGIYNSTSGVNNLNQFIIGEKITKTLSPRFGCIQKLHARDTDLVTLCEDKVVRCLANKDAIFNADGNAQLISTDRVLGQVVPFQGEHGISKNPESFAVQAYQAYFSDKSRGVVMRLSQNGLVPVSEHGMKDWFNDNLKHAQTIIGSYDDRKSLYHITLKNKAEEAISIEVPTQEIDFADANSLGYFHFDNGGGFGIQQPFTYGTIGSSTASYTNYTGLTSYAYGQYDANDTHISGGGTLPLVKQIHIPTIDYYGANVSSSFLTFLEAFNDCPEGSVYLHYQVQAGHPSREEAPANYSDTGAPIVTYKVDSITMMSTGAYDIRVTYHSGAHAQIDTSYFWWTSEGCEVVEGDNSASTTFVEATLSFAEKTNGWVSFKSWLQESGLSMNGKFYTFSSGNIWEHASNLNRNNFYGVQYNSTVDVLLNGGPNMVKSFQSLKYSGSQAKITQNNLTGTNSAGNNQFDNEYYNNIGKTGWYASSIETDLQSGKELEFKPKEGKWFATMQGLSTYFNSASDTNVDEKEFSVQGIAYASTISITNDDNDPIDPTPTDFTLTIKDDPSDH